MPDARNILGSSHVSQTQNAYGEMGSVSLDKLLLNKIVKKNVKV